MRRYLSGAAILVVPRALWGHAGAAIAPHDLWSAWESNPAILLPLALFALGYAFGLRRMPRVRGNTLRPVAFLFAFLTLALAIVSPLHALGGALFSAHMVQHELLVTVAAPLLVLAHPAVVTMWGFSPERRRAIGNWLRVGWVRKTGATLVAAGPAWALHAAALWLWHVPGPYQETLRSPLVHALQHLSFFGTAVLFWWSILEAARLHRGIALLSLFTTMLHTGALGVVLTFADRLWYPVYATSTVPWGLTPLEDQQLGGLIMWIPGGVGYLVAALAVAARALRESETRAHRWVPQASGLLLLLAVAGCDRHDDHLPSLAGGDADRGRQLIRRYGCGSCHMIPGVRGAGAMVGPPLAGIANRVYVGGVVTNTPENLVRWIETPKAIDEKTAMPNVGVSQADAVDIASYLYTLK